MLKLQKTKKEEIISIYYVHLFIFSNSVCIHSDMMQKDSNNSTNIKNKEDHQPIKETDLLKFPPINKSLLFYWLYPEVVMESLEPKDSSHTVWNHPACPSVRS